MITIGVPAESPEETRIGLSPETAKKLVKNGAKVSVRSGAGLRSHFSDADYRDAGATIAASDDAAVKDADIVLTVRRPPLAAGEGDEARRHGDRHARSVRRCRRPRDAGEDGREPVRHGTPAAYQPCPNNGRAIEPGQPGRLQGRDRCGCAVRPRHADDDDRRRDYRARARAGDGGGRRRPSGHRHRAPSGRHRFGHRCSARHQGTGGIAGRHLRCGDGRRIQRGADRRRLRQGNVAGDIRPSKRP